MNFEKIAARFQQRLAEMVARYEADIAIQAQQYEDTIEDLKKELDELREESSNVVSASNATPEPKPNKNAG